MWGFALEPTKRIGGVSPPRRPIRHRPGASRKASGILGWIPGGAGNSWRTICSPVIALVVIWLLGMIIWNSGIISLKKQTTAPSDSPTGLDASSEYGDDAASMGDGSTDDSSDLTPSFTNKMSSGGGYGGGLGTGSRAGSGAGFGAGTGAGSGAGFGAADEGMDSEDGDGETGLASGFPRSTSTTGAGRLGGLNSGDSSRTSAWNAPGGGNRGGLGASGGDDEDDMMGSGGSGGSRDGFGSSSSSRDGMWGGSGSGGAGRFGGGGAGAGGSRWGGGGASTWGGRGGSAGMSAEDEDEDGKGSAGGGGLGVSSSRVPKTGSRSWGMDDEGDMETAVSGNRGVESAQLDDEEEEEEGMSTHRLRNVAFLRIPGTPVTGQRVLDFERQLACVSRDGLWAVNSTPRWMPWDLNPLSIDRQPNYRSCDLLFAKRCGVVPQERAECLGRSGEGEANFQRKGGMAGAQGAAEGRSVWSSSGARTEVAQCKSGMAGAQGAAVPVAPCQPPPLPLPPVPPTTLADFQTAPKQHACFLLPPSSPPNEPSRPFRKGGVFGAAAERARRSPNARAAWRVRKELLYQWRPASPRRCPFQQFDRAGFCRAVRGRNVVVVGDAFSLDWHDSLLNHLVTAGTKNKAGQLGDAWGRNVVVVGDAFSLDWHDSLLNHLATEGTKNKAGQLGDAWANVTEGACFERGHRLCTDVPLIPPSTPTTTAVAAAAAAADDDSSTLGDPDSDPATASAANAGRFTAGGSAAGGGGGSGGGAGGSGLGIGGAGRRSRFGAAADAAADDTGGEDRQDRGEEEGARGGQESKELGVVGGLRSGFQRKGWGRGRGLAGRVRAGDWEGDERSGEAAGLGSRERSESGEGEGESTGFTRVEEEEGLGAGGGSGRAGRTGRKRRAVGRQGGGGDVLNQGVSESLSNKEGGTGGVVLRRRRMAGFNLRVVLNAFAAPDTGRPTRLNNRWLKRLKKWKTSILVLSRTPAFGDSEWKNGGDGVEEKELMLQEVRDTLEAVRDLYPDMLVIWRSAVGGHPSCQHFTRPLRTRPVLLAAKGKIPDVWLRHAEMNAAIRPLLKEYGAVYMDVDSATSLRPDGHHERMDGSINCHHYCMPGPLSVGGGAAGGGGGGSVYMDVDSATSLRPDGHHERMDGSINCHHYCMPGPLDHWEYGAVFMDVDSSTSLRPDGHHERMDGSINCHHYCMPGPLDHWFTPLTPTSLLFTVLPPTSPLSPTFTLFPPLPPPIPACTNFSACIPGTRIRGEEAVAEAQQEVSCVAEDGKWVRFNTPRWLPWSRDPHTNPRAPHYGTCDLLHVNETGGKGMYGFAADKFRKNPGDREWHVRAELKYQWKANRFCPPFMGFNRHKFCAAVGQRNVLFVGDTTQLALHDVFLNHVTTIATQKEIGDIADAWTAPNNQPACAINNPHVVCSDIVPGGFTFRVAHNNLLTPDSPGGGAFNQRWLGHLRKWNISIVVLNKGFEHRPTPVYLKTLRQTLTKFRQVAPDTLLIWRSTWRGHEGCENATEPLAAPPDNATRAGPWAFVLEQNEAVRDLIREFGGVYMNLDFSLSMRPDGHLRQLNGLTDCYYYCLPGPVDHFMRLLYNYLLILDSKGPVSLAQGGSKT
ncbi:unnamed protein product [Closterium sp. NIES-65]|nr:unnamed protein product [Closterium sp. NIES-65]